MIHHIKTFALAALIIGVSLSKAYAYDGACVSAPAGADVVMHD